MNNKTPITEIRSIGYADPDLNAKLQANTDNSVSSYLDLRNRYAEALSRVQILSINPGADSEEYKAAVVEADAIKQQLINPAGAAGKRFSLAIPTRQWWHTDKEENPKP